MLAVVTAAERPALQGPYANDAWGCACHDGNANHIEGAEHLGFKWFNPGVPPGR